MVSTVDWVLTYFLPLLRPSNLLPMIFGFFPKFNRKSRFRYLNPFLEYLNILFVVWALSTLFSFCVMRLSDSGTGSWHRRVQLFTVVDYRTGDIVSPGYTIAQVQMDEDGTRQKPSRVFCFLPKFNKNTGRWQHLNPFIEWLNVFLVGWTFLLSFAFFVIYLSDSGSQLSFDRGVHLFNVVDQRTGDMVNWGYTVAIMKKREDGNHNWCWNTMPPSLSVWKKKELDMVEVRKRLTAATVNQTRSIEAI